MMTTSASSQFSIVASLLTIGAILLVIKFRKKVRLIRSLSDNRDLDVYVPYNMLFYGFSRLGYLSYLGHPKFRWKLGMAFPYDEKNEAVLQELKSSWPISFTMILTIWFALGTGFLALISHSYK
jgi:hypothetical protein